MDDDDNDEEKRREEVEGRWKSKPSTRIPLRQFFTSSFFSSSSGPSVRSSSDLIESVVSKGANGSREAYFRELKVIEFTMTDGSRFMLYREKGVQVPE